MFPFLVLVSLVIYLTIWGAGIFPGATLVVTGIFSLALLLISFFPSPDQNKSFVSWSTCLIILTWLTLTALPLPNLFESLTGETRKDQNDLVRKELTSAATLGVIDNIDPQFSLSRNRMGTIRTLVYLAGIVAAMGLSLCLTPSWKWRYLRALVVVVAIIALLGFIGQHIFLQGNKIWWKYPVAWGDPIACFVNRSHFGGFVALLCPTAIICCAKDFAARKWIIASIELICFLVMSTAVASCNSRGAFLTFLIGLVAVGMFSISKEKRFTGIFISILVCISFMTTGFFILGQTGERLQDLRTLDSDRSSQSRISIWKDSVKIMKDFPFLGSGADSFRTIFSSYNSRITTKSIVHAESSLIQLLACGGIIGFLMFASLLITYFQRYLDSNKNHRMANDLAICANCAVICALAQALVDVAFYIPLYGIVLGSIIGLPCRIVRRTSKSPRKPTHESVGKNKKLERLTATSYHSFKTLKILLYLVKSIQSYSLRILAVMGLLITCISYGLWDLKLYHFDKTYFISKTTPGIVARGLIYAPTSWQNWFQMGVFSGLIRDRENLRLSERCLTRAAEYNPQNYILWEKLYNVRRQLNKSEAAEIAKTKMNEVLPTHIRESQEKLKQKYIRRKLREKWKKRSVKPSN